MDIDYQAGIRGLKYAAKKGLGVVVMEPLRGGRLSKPPPQEVSNLWKSSQHTRTPTEWALLWVWNHPEVSVVLSGMSTLEQVIENITLASNFKTGILNPDDLALFDRVREAYLRLSPVPCTGCSYCMPCASGVNIPRIFELYNESIIYNDPQEPRIWYREPNLKEEEHANNCVECGNCVEKCPQEIAIPESLKKAHELLF